MPLGMRYTGVFSSVAVTAQQDFFELLAPADAVVLIHWIQLTQSTEVGDAQEEGLAVLLKRGVGTVTSGSGGTSPTPAKQESGFQAAGSTLEANNTTKMATGTGTITTLWSDNWNVRSQFLWTPTPDFPGILSPSERLTVELGTTPADSITMSGTIVFSEIGG